jgi:hypothetical protein
MQSVCFGNIFMFHPSLEPYFYEDLENKFKKLDYPKSNSPLALNGFCMHVWKMAKKGPYAKAGIIVMYYKKVLQYHVHNIYKFDSRPFHVTKIKSV